MNDMISQKMIYSEFTPAFRWTTRDISKCSAARAGCCSTNRPEAILRCLTISMETSLICIGVYGSSRRNSAESSGICSTPAIDFEYMKKMLHSQAVLPDVRRAAYYYALIRYSYAAGTSAFGSQPHAMWNNFPLIEAAAGRLQKVIVENKDCVKLISQYDRPESFFYCDPPYYQADQYYEAVSADGFDHQGLAEALFSIKGKFLLSYNDCEFIRELYTRPGIVIEGTTRLSNIAQRYDNGKQYPELLISNYDTTELARSCVQLTLFDGLDTQEILNERILYNGTI